MEGINKMLLKEYLKKNKKLKLIVKKFKVILEYQKDAYHLNKYIAENEKNKEQIEYKMLLLIHSIEKGMCYPNPRPFGNAKIEELIALLKKYDENLFDKNSNSYKMAVSIIYNWLDFYVLNSWQNNVEYKKVEKYFKETWGNNLNNKKTGFSDRIINSVKDYNDGTYESVINTRFSARDYSEKPLSMVDLTKAINLAKKTPSACNRQMIKAHFITDDNGVNLLSKVLHGTGGLNWKTVKYFVITFDSNSLDFYGERNQGYLNAGLFAMNLVNSLHSVGIGTCFLQFANTSKEEKMLKEKLKIPKSERIAVCISCGYYTKENRIPVSCRKETEEVFIIH